MAFVCVQVQARELEAELRAFADPEGAGLQRLCHHVLAALSQRTGALSRRSSLGHPGTSPLLGDSSLPEGTEAQNQLLQVCPQHGVVSTGNDVCLCMLHFARLQLDDWHIAREVSCTTCSGSEIIPCNHSAWLSCAFPWHRR